MSLPIKATKAYGRITQNADTLINRLIEPRRRLFTVCNALRYTSLGTAHTLTLLRCLARTTASAAAASGQAVINITADTQANSVAGALAANDIVVVELSDGTFQQMVVSSRSSLAITMTGNFNANVNAGARIWFFGVIGDGHQTLSPATSATTDYPAGTNKDASVFESNGPDEPLIIQSTNATAAGIIQHASAVYCAFGRGGL